MSEQVRVAEINVEGARRHWDRLNSFLTQNVFQVLALNEVFAVDVPVLAELHEFPYYAFLPNLDIQCHLWDRVMPAGLFGVALLSRFPQEDEDHYYYVGPGREVPKYTDPKSYPINRGVLTVRYPRFSVSTTHFTWTPDGSNSAEQWRDWERLNTHLSKLSPDIIVGDFNVPRGSALGNTIESIWHSHLPGSVKTTLDAGLHRNPDIPNHVVDYVLTHPNGKVNIVPGSVTAYSGVSDHCAIVSTFTY